MKGIAYRPLSDMETNGVYFEQDELLLLGDESLCQYSGLPSVKSYEAPASSLEVETEPEILIGHA